MSVDLLSCSLVADGKLEMGTQLVFGMTSGLALSQLEHLCLNFPLLKQKKVSTIMCGQNWHIPAHLPWPIQQLLQSCSSISLPSVPVPDSAVWIANSTGRPSVKDAWNLVQSKATPVGWSKLVWNNLVRPRIYTLIWTLLHRKTPTKYG